MNTTSTINLSSLLKAFTVAFFMTLSAGAVKANNDLPSMKVINSMPKSKFEVSSFTTSYKNYQMICTWSVSNQESIKAYELEGSDNGSSFRSVRSILAHKSEKYTLVNTRKQNICEYYRLKMVDSDGGVYYSLIVPTRSAQ